MPLFYFQCDNLECDQHGKQFYKLSAPGKLGSTEFWGWIRKQTALVFVSEYIAPEDFVCVFQAATNGLRTSKTAKKPERLFVRRADLERYPYLKELVIEKQGGQQYAVPVLFHT